MMLAPVAAKGITVSVAALHVGVHPGAAVRSHEDPMRTAAIPGLSDHSVMLPA